ncbi:hypothetical protein C8F04DRAFT_1040168 [Mycena alexandri]|uniref:F-box domain-containing protein n=1 Tax=Mycena alexandri TaxID=1745969 RepID=A0AAD6X208_9AGAR|nr:hypothetical protein C8F04DRAFT_1040168 [Mycena alexandri]
MDSPFLDRLHSNYIPSDDEIKVIQTAILARSRDLERINETIRSLTAERDKIQDYIDAHKALLSYARRLPHDIVQAIFTACLPHDRNAVMSREEAPLLLCEICGVWRNLALNTPRLWASLHVPVEFLSGNVSRMRFLSQWLDRSGVTPLSLSVSNGLGFSYGFELLDAVNLLVGYSGRWRHLELLDFSAEALSVLAGVDAPTLASIKISVTPGWQNIQMNMLQEQTLRSVCFQWFGINDNILDAPVAWHQLTQLSITHFDVGYHEWEGLLSLHHAFMLLQRCHRLISFEFGPTAEDCPELPGPVTLPLLRSLVMCKPSRLQTVSIERLLQNLRLPELRTLHIHVPTFAPSATTFLADIGRQSSLIHDLRIDLSAFNKELLLDALGYIPSLTKLHITDSDSWGALADESPIDAPQLLQLLTPDPGFHLSIVCPLLQELTVLQCSPVSEDILFAFLQNRIDLETDFRALKIFFQREEASKHDVERFRERGLKIQFKFPQLRKSLPTPWYGLWPKDSDDVFAQWD